MCRVARASGSLLPSDLLGQRVRLHGLRVRSELNGQVGIVRAYHADKQRHAVQLESGEGARASDGWHASGPPLLLLPQNLEVLGLESAAEEAARRDEMLRAERYVERAIEHKPSEKRRLRRMLAALYQAQLHRVTLAAAEHAGALDHYSSRSEIPDDLWDTLGEQQQQCKYARLHCERVYTELLVEALDADDPSCWSRTAAMMCKFVAGEPGRSSEARSLASKVARLHACGGRCHDIHLARAVCETEGPVTVEAAVSAPDCPLLDVSAWAQLRESEALRRELRQSWSDENLAVRARDGRRGEEAGSMGGPRK